jgi:hypothetical protein
MHDVVNRQRQASFGPLDSGFAGPLSARWRHSDRTNAAAE